MLNFRQFEAGPDPFGRKFPVMLKWLQTAISIRHADTVDVKFILIDENQNRGEKTIALPLPELLTLSREIGRALDDPWCGRWAALHLKQPVRWTASRSESFLADEHARDVLLYTELGLDAEGRFTALRVRL